MAEKRQIWGRFEEERGDLFLVSFESKKDRTKVLKGGAWCFDRTPVCLEVYDHITPMADVPMCHVRMWVIVSLIPPRYEEPDNLCFFGNLLGGYLDYDRTEFRKGVMKILFTHDIYKPVHLERQVHLDPGVEPMLRLNFLQLLGRCSVCNMITHAGKKCDGTHTVLGTSRGINFRAQPKPGYAFSAKPTIGVAINLAIVVSSSLVVKRKHVVCRLERTETSEIDESGLRRMGSSLGSGNSTLEIEVAFELETSPIVLEAVVGKDVVLSTTPSKK
ncbi:hypothetical protein ACLB2K_034936 [Fragaria x ananassa]